MKYPLLVLLGLLCVVPAVFFSCATLRDNARDSSVTDDFIPAGAALSISEFSEVWAYLIDGNEDALLSDLPLTDVAYFGADVDSYGGLVSVPDRSKIAFFPGRVHLAVKCDSRGLTHFILSPESPARNTFIAQLIKATAPYDGLNIDLELIPANDGEYFLSFLAELRAGLSDKMLTIAVPARLRTIADDVFAYAKIAPLVDRVFVMAYDEHWSASDPGSIASMDWCARIASYAQTQIERDKLVMGLPFYGRTWGSVNTFRAFFHSGIERIKGENNVKKVSRKNGVPFFSYEIPVTVTVYYEDAVSLTTRLAMYSGMGIKHAGFWCLGQEDPEIWQYIRVNAPQQAVFSE